MKKITLGIAIMLAVFASSALYGAGPRGVAGVDVILKQNPSKRVVTNARGEFAFDGLAPGSYTLTFRARKAQDTKTAKSDEVTVATSYSITIAGGKRMVMQSNLTSDNLINGLNMIVQVTSPKVRGQVTADGLKRMGLDFKGTRQPYSRPVGSRRFAGGQGCFQGKRPRHERGGIAQMDGPGVGRPPGGFPSLRSHAA